MQQNATASTLRNNHSVLLNVGFGVILLLMLSLMTYSLVSIDKTRGELDKLVDDYMEKVSLSISMRTAARNRTLILFELINISDPFEQDDALVEFGSEATRFLVARDKILKMPLEDSERELLKAQAAKSDIAIPIQKKLYPLFSGEGREKPEDCLLKERFQHKMMF